MKKFLLLLILSTAATAQTSSNLPLVFIDTHGKAIVDEPKIMADLKIIDNGEGNLNEANDPAAYEGIIGIEFRGSSSQMFPKKPYGFETWDSSGAEIDTTLFGWPASDDWIFFASYNEKSLIHNVLSMQIAREMGLYASRTKYVELYLNGAYQGVYVAMEKIKRGKGRVNIAKLNPDEESGDDLTGGYIVKIDKPTGSNQGSFLSEYSNITPRFKPTEFFYEYPKDITTTQKEYIKSYIGDFEKALTQNDFANAPDNYRDYINLKSFVLITILNEVSRNVDGYRISSYMYKDKDSKGGKLTLGPPWDYDISYGNANYCDGNNPQGFSYNFNAICPEDNWFVPFWWQRFLSDPVFISELRNTYDDLRQNGILQESKLLELIDGYEAELKTAQARNFQKWPIIGQYVWPSPLPIANSWAGEVQEIRDWLSKRLKWLDNNLPREFSILSTQANEIAVKVYPNPFVESLSVSLSSDQEDLATFKVYDMTGKSILDFKAAVTEGQNHINIPLNSTALVSSVYYMDLSFNNKTEKIKLIKR